MPPISQAIARMSKLYVGAADTDLRALVAHLKLAEPQLTVTADGDAFADRVRCAMNGDRRRRLGSERENTEAERPGSEHGGGGQWPGVANTEAGDSGPG